MQDRLVAVWVSSMYDGLVHEVVNIVFHGPRGFGDGVVRWHAMKAPGCLVVARYFAVTADDPPVAAPRIPC